jgi:hypothetical protein
MRWWTGESTLHPLAYAEGTLHMTPTAVVRPLPGPGLVARSGDLLLVCADGAGGAEELLGLVAEVAFADGDGGMLVRRVAAVLAADFAGRFPACAACGPTADGRLAVLVHGTATARVVGGDGEVVALSAADAVTSVNRLVAGPISAVRLELPGAGEANPLARLEAGVVTAAGVVSGEGLSGPNPAGQAWPPAVVASVVLPVQPPAPHIEAAAAQVPGPDVAWNASSMMDSAAVSQGSGGEWPPAPAPEWLPAALADPPPSDLDLASPAPAEASPSAEPLPVRQPNPGAPFVSVPIGTLGDAEPPAPVADVRPWVLGLACSNGHLSDPKSPTCINCGAPLDGQTAVLREGPRPPLGVLLLDDGATFVLDTGYVLGREPQQDPEVLAGTARPLKITDADGVVSRRHVRVALVGWDIQVIDLGSANGTFVQIPGDPQRHQLAAHHPIVIRPGAQVTMGRRWFRVETLRPDPGQS